MSNDGYTVLNEQETEQLIDEAWDRACLKRGVKPVRADGQDSWAQIQHDFPSIFGRDKSA